MMRRLLVAIFLLATVGVRSVSDVTPPSISMNFVDGNQVIPGTTAGILVWATDDVGVEAVDVWADGKFICHVTAPSTAPFPEPKPYECLWKVNGRSTHTLVAQACDVAENCASVTSHPLRWK
jgi:hypothetical protein